MTVYQTGSGRAVRAASVLGKGGEGTVYHVDGDASIAVKIYTDGKQQERQPKISALVAGEFYKASNLVAFPIEMLFNGAGAFVGFTMRKVTGFKPLHELYSPGSRRIEFPTADFRFLVRTAINISKAVANIHLTGCVIGDINHSGILVSSNAVVTLIDSDSFQVISGGYIYRCRVGTSEYTPPELQGTSFEKVERQSAHDGFGLAVIVFQLLFLGRHPFAGRFAGTGDMPIEKAIREGRFAYSAHKSQTRMEPPPFVPTLSDVTPDIAIAFERAFTSDPRQYATRPSAKEWVSVLERFEAELITCRFNPAHHHPRNASNCPWCRLEAGMGVSLFPQGAGATTASPSTFDISACMKSIDGIAAPGPVPDPISAFPPPIGLTLSPAAKQAKTSAYVLKAAGVALIAVALGFAVKGFPIGLLALFGAGYLLVHETKERGQLKAQKQRAEGNWQQAKAEWENEASDRRFIQKRDNLRALAAEHARLPSVEKSRLDDLDRRRHQIQLQRHLEGHLIARSQISGIGAGRKTVLASYGIENAFDVTASAVRAVPGFGEGLTNKMLAWRRSVEARFVFNPSLGTDPAAIRSVKEDIARQRRAIEQSLLRGPMELEQLRSHALAAQRRPTARLIEAYRALKQAELDLQ